MSLALLLSMISVGFVWAQQEQKPVKKKQVRVARYAERMKQELNLTDAQVAKLKDVEVSILKERQQMKQSVRNSRTDFMSKVQEHNKEIQKILTPEQYQKYQVKMQQLKARMSGYRMGKHDARRMYRQQMQQAQ